MVKAIETCYKGYRFRSRLEARWAVFFDALGWEWRYEHQGYEIGWEENPRFWLPDFEVTTPSGSHYYVEVKGDKNYFANDNFVECLDFGCGPPGFHNSSTCGVLLLGDIPDPCFFTYLVPILFHDEGVNLHWRHFSPNDCFDLQIDANQFYSIDAVEYSLQRLDDFQIKKYYPTMRSTLVSQAFQRARSARFEHGETP